MKPVRAWMLKRKTLASAYGWYHTRRDALRVHPETERGQWVRVEIREVVKARKGVARDNG